MKIINQKNNCNLNENVNFKQEKEEYVIYLGDNIPVVMKSSLKVKSINKINNEKSNGSYLISYDSKNLYRYSLK